MGRCTNNHQDIALSNDLIVIRNAWHFCYALRFLFKVLCGSFGIALLTS
nr:DUF3265 domain-containing protein [Vibrio sp. Of14-4]